MRYEGTVYRPPSEARSLIFQITIGCAHNGCTFCTMYKDKKFRIRTMDEIRDDISDAYLSYGDNIRRIFLADGDALVVETEMLLEILSLIKTYFPSCERVTAYGAPKDILNKSVNELKLLKDAGLDMVYTGLESGDDVILKKINKGVDVSEITEACIKIKEAEIKSSVTLISGLGGKERFFEHAKESAKAISKIKPDYAGFLTLMLEPGSLIIKEIEEGNFELPGPEDVLSEMEIFLKNVDSEGTIFRANHASNYLILKGTLNKDIPEMLKEIERIKNSGGYRDENWRSL